jgi:hypothetical protein
MSFAALALVFPALFRGVLVATVAWSRFGPYYF